MSDKNETIKLEQDMVEVRYPIIKFFKYNHLPEHLQAVSKVFCDAAWDMALNLPVNAETSACLRKLLEAKDCAVRATL
jgi:hypothetical protein